MKTPLTIIALFCMLPLLRSQQLPTYSQYHINRYLLNPAAAGIEGATSISFIGREQWVRFPDAPSSYLLSFDSRILKNSWISQNSSLKKKRKNKSRSGRVGWGGYFYNDQNGLMERTGMQATYAYHIRMRNSQLSFGASMTGFQLKFNEEGMVLSDNEFDPLVAVMSENIFVPDANIGVIYKTQKYYGGLSVDQIMQSAIKLGGEGISDYQLRRNANLMGGYRIFLSDDLEVDPIGNIRLIQGNGMQIDLTGKVLYRDMVWGGLTYRTGHSVLVFMGATFKGAYVGYAFDWTLNQMMKHSLGSHEFVLGIKLGDGNYNYKWMNRF